MTKIQVALFDADGVVIKPRSKFFSQRLIDDYGISELQASAFVSEAIVPSMIDEVDLKKCLSTYIARWRLPVSVDELLSNWWSGENTLNTDVLQIVDSLKLAGIQPYLASDQERYRATYIMELSRSPKCGHAVLTC